MGMLFEKMLGKCRDYPVPYRFYVASLFVYFVGFGFYSYAGTPSLNVVTLAASALIICGFVVWCIPIARWLHAVWDRPFGKTPIVLMHLLALLASTACARFAVAESLGLPPQSFDLTVGFLALLFYVPALLGIMAVVLGFFAVVFMLIAAIGLVVDTVWQQMLAILSIFGFKLDQKPVRNMMFFHIAGALIGSVLLALSYSYLTENFSSAFKTMTRVIALRSDFHKAPNYPGYRSGEYVHPLENGFIAYAREEEDKSVAFGVRLQPTEKQDVAIESIPSIKKIVSGLVDSAQ